MAFKYFPLLVALACSLILANALPTHHNIQKRSGMKLCGRMLVEALAAVCQNEYYDPSHNQHMRKRNYAYAADAYNGWDSSYPEPEGFVEPQTALDFFSVNQLSRNSRGVADECCQKSCSYSQLLSYCGPSPRSTGGK